MNYCKHTYRFCQKPTTHVIQIMSWPTTNRKIYQLPSSVPMFFYWNSPNYFRFPNLWSFIAVFEPWQDKTCLWEFPTRPDTNRPGQPQKLARVFKISAVASRDIILFKQWTTKALIRLCECAGWSELLLFAYDIRHIFLWLGSFISDFRLLIQHLLLIYCLTKFYGYQLGWKIT